MTKPDYEHVRGAVKEAQMQMCTCVVSQTIWKQTFFGSGITKAFSTLGSSSSTNQRILLDNNFNLCSALIYFQPSVRSCSVVSPQATMTEKYVCRFPVKCTLSSVGYDHFCHDPWQVFGFHVFFFFFFTFFSLSHRSVQYHGKMCNRKQIHMLLCRVYFMLCLPKA